MTISLENLNSGKTENSMESGYLQFISIKKTIFKHNNNNGKQKS